MRALLIAAAVLYGAVALGTYGHAYVGLEQRECERGRCDYSEGDATFGAILSAAAWPLYWSVQVARWRAS